MPKLSRRDFLKASAIGLGTIVVSTGLTGCNDDDDQQSATFLHGVASGDPLADSLIIWTRATPERENEPVTVVYEAATDQDFTNLVHQGEAETNADQDFTVKVDLQNLTAGTMYYYRFRVGDTTSPVGKGKTLPQGSVSQVKMAVFSCANYPKGYFNVYSEAAKVDDLDVALHLGDYIYEYGMYKEDDGVTPAYATENAANIGRVLPSDNDTECLTLDDYRKRYALYHTDAGTQALHAAVPMIAVWDDHEIANDTYETGAENHNEDDGTFVARKLAAVQAYFEWLPIRNPQTEDIYRSFDFGNLISLHMMETRLKRTKQLSYDDFMTMDDEGQIVLDSAAFQVALLDSSRTLTGETQLTWLQGQMAASTAYWQVLGQQVLMGRMNLPVELLTYVAALEGDLSDEEKAALVEQINVVLTELVTIKTRIAMGDTTVTEEESARVTTVAPYNLDAWDGYFMERETILGTALQTGKSLVVLAGDTHNAWASNLKAVDSVTYEPTYPAGVEFATSSVSSPGMEEYFGLADDTAAAQLEAAWTALTDDLVYNNLNNRGFMVVTFTPEQAACEWIFVDNIDSETYQVSGTRGHSATVALGANTLA